MAVWLVRYVAHLAALIGLVAFGAALGDYVSDPSVLGAVGLLALFVAIAVALATLYRPGGWGSSRPAPATSPRPPRADLKARRGRPSDQSAPLDTRTAPAPAEADEPDEEPLWSEAPRAKPRRPSPTADAGWDAREADTARESRRSRRRRRKS